MGDDATDVELDTAPEVRAAAAVVLERVGPLVRRALVARFGTDVGADAAADAIAWGWEHGRAITSMANPGGYLYRVGQTSARRAQCAGASVVVPGRTGVDGRTSSGW